MNSCSFQLNPHYAKRQDREKMSDNYYEKKCNKKSKNKTSNGQQLDRRVFALQHSSSPLGKKKKKKSKPVMPARFSLRSALPIYHTKVNDGMSK